MEYIEAMPFCDVVALFDYWREYPPVHILLRGQHTAAPQRAEPDAPGKLMLLPGGRGARKLKRAPAHIREAAERMKARG